MEIFGVILSLIGLMYFAYRGVNVLVLAPIMAIIATLFHTDAPLMGSYTQVFMPALGGYLLKYFPIFLLGSIFGRLMSDSGQADKIAHYIAEKLGAQRAILAVVLACALLTYGGVSLFVVAFCIYPIAVSLFKEGNIPEKFIPASIALGSFTFTMTALPGTPSIQNAIPMPFFQTTAFAAPGLGLLGGALMAVGGYLWLMRRASKAKKDGIGFGHFYVIEDKVEQAKSDVKVHEFFKAILPLLLVISLNYLFSKFLFPELDLSYLAKKQFGEIKPQAVIGLWSLISALTVATIVLYLLNIKNFKSALLSFNEGTMKSLLPIFNTASEVGYGATIASLASFSIIKDSVLSIAPNYPLVSEAVSINVLAGITGSASGGLSIALKALAENYLAMAQTVGLSPELLHRVASMSCGGFDTLPHNGAVITLLTICGLGHKQSYFDIGIVAVVVPFLSTTVVIILGTLVGSF